jgi:hypothetical protein
LAHDRFKYFIEKQEGVRFLYVAKSVLRTVMRSFKTSSPLSKSRTQK